MPKKPPFGGGASAPGLVDLPYLCVIIIAIIKKEAKHDSKPGDDQKSYLYSP
jgi:hypothetical protein